MEKQEPQAISLAEIIEIVKRRQMTLLLCVVVALIPVLLHNYLATPIYEATAILAFENYSKEPMAGFDFSGALSRGNFVANRIQEMKTKTFARQVYDELPDSARRRFRFPEPLPADFNADLLVQNYPVNHPKLTELKAEIEQAKQNLIQTTMKLIEGEKPQGIIDPLSQLQKYLEESIALDVELQALSAKEANLRQILDNYSGYLKKLPDKELILVRLMRDKEMNTKTYTRLLEEREQARIREAAEIGNIRIMEPAETPRVAARPQKLLNVAIGLFCGIVLGLVWIFAAEFSKEIPRTQEEIERILRLPVLAAVPQIKRGLSFSLNGQIRQRLLLSQAETAPFVRDAFSYLWSSMQFSNRRKPLLVMITSSGPAEDKSAIAANLALTAARHGKNTILIDGDLRKPVLHEMFGVAFAPGLINLVAKAGLKWRALALPAETKALLGNETTSGIEKWAEKDQRSICEEIFPSLDTVLQPTAVENLRLLAMGEPLLAPDVVWGSPVIEEILSMLKRTANFVVIDTPPLIGMPDASMIAHYCDGILLCVEAGRTEKKILLRAQKILDQGDNKLWGVVLNKVEPDTIYGNYKYYKYYVKHYHKNG